MVRRPTLIALISLGIIAVGLFVVKAADQTWGANGNSAWYTAGNWAGGAFPGLQGAAASNTDSATWTSAATGTTFGINMGTNSLNLGAVVIDSTRTTATNIGNSSGTAGVLRLYGKTVNGVPNVIVRNNGTGLLTLQAAQSGTMGVVLSNATENIINIDNTGGVTISSIISGSGMKLTRGGAGAGTLTLSGVNTYSGNTTISTGTLALSGTGSIANSPNIVIAGGATFSISALGANLTLASGQGVNATGTATTGTIATGGTPRNLTTAANSPLQFTAFNGTTAPLTISGSGTVTLASGNPVTVNTTVALTAGTYTLIAKGASGTVAGSAPTSLSIGGSGIAAGTTAFLQITGAQLVLQVVSTTGKYQSRQTGNWNDFNTWQTDTGSGYVNAVSGQTPASAADTIQIQSPHVVTVTANVDADQMTIDSGGTVSVNSGVTFTIADGTGTDLTDNGTLATAGSITNNGQASIVDTLQINTGGSVSGAPSYGASSLLKYNTGGTFARGAEWTTATSGPGYPGNVQVSNNTNFNFTSGDASNSREMAGSLTVDLGSTFDMTGMFSFLFCHGNATINGTFTGASSQVGQFRLSGNWANNGTYNNGGGTAQIYFDGAGSPQTLGGSTITAYGSLQINNSLGVTVNTDLTATQVRLLFGPFNNGAHVTLTSGALIFRSSGTFGSIPTFGATVNVTYGNSVSAVVTDKEIPTSTTVLNNLTMQNSTGVTLGADATVNGTLTLTNDLATGAFLLTENGTSAGTGDVLGTVRRTDLGGAVRDFGNPNVEITIVSGDITAMDVFCQKAAPGGFASAVQRTYSLEPVTGSVVTDATVKLHYRDSELQSNDPLALTLWRAVTSTDATWTDQGATGITRATGSEPDNWVQKTGVTAFSAWTLASAPQAPTAVKLTSFTAIQTGDEVMLQWQSGSEARNLGYNIYRQQNGKRVAITPSLVAGSALIAGRQTTLTAGLSYTWYDQLAGINAPTKGVTYWLEDVDLDGTRTMHGPIAPLLQYRKLKPAGPRAKLLSEVSRRTPASGIEFNAYPAAFAGQRADLVTPNISDPDATATQQQIEARGGIKIAVSKAGWYRISQPQLVAAGLDPNVNAPQLQLYENGRAVPIKQSGDQAHLTSSDYIEFYGHGLDLPTEATQTYYLVLEPDHFGTRIRDLDYRNPAQLPPPSGPTSFDYTVERRERMIYFSGILNGDVENFYGQVVTETPVSSAMPLNNLDEASVAAGTPARLEVSLQGVTNQSHSVHVSINGTDLGEISFANLEHPTATFAVPAAALQDGDNAVEFTSLGGSADVSLVDTLRLTYAHSYAADKNSLAVSINNDSTRRVSGFTSDNIRVVDITQPADALEITQTVRVNSESDGTYSVDIQLQGASFRHPHTLLVFTDKSTSIDAAVKQNNPSTWCSQTAGADYVIISSGELMAAVEPLAALRRNQGLVVQVIDVEDLYDEYTFGQHAPQAIHDYLDQARTSWKRKAHYVLLAGDASYDPKNYSGQGLNDLVPTKLIDTSLMEAASDDWLTDFNNDGLPDLSVGRLPVRTVADMNALVAKIVGYENAAPDPTRGALLVADTSFEGQSTVVRGLLPAGLPVATINRSSADDATIHNQIVAAINQGPRVTNFVGHGSNGVWTGGAVLSSYDAPALTNTNRLSVFTMMTCFNGYFQDAYNDSLSEALLKAPGGAVAVWASTTLTQPAGQNLIDQEFYRLLFGQQPATLGDAARAAKVVTSDADVRRTWTLFGDPAMRLR